MIKGKRKCQGCLQYKPLKRFYFYKTKNRHDSFCVTCARDRNREVMSIHKKDWKGIGTRICNGILCRGDKEFYSTAGERFCKTCRSIMKNMSDPCSDYGHLT